MAFAYRLRCSEDEYAALFESRAEDGSSSSGESTSGSEDEVDDLYNASRSEPSVGISLVRAHFATQRPRPRAGGRLDRHVSAFVPHSGFRGHRRRLAGPGGTSCPSRAR